MEPEMRRIELNLKERIAASFGSVGSFNTREFDPGNGGDCIEFYVQSNIKVVTQNPMTDCRQQSATEAEELKVEACGATMAARAAFMDAINSGI